jgi:ABC-type branched-subunit amino acid transport system ATPase component
VIRSVEIKGLRGIREGALTELTPLVVLVGPNGSGKSTVLDALLIAANPRPGEGIGLAGVRREGVNASARWLLWRAGLGEPAELLVTTDSRKRRFTLSITSQSRDMTVIEGRLVDYGADDQPIHESRVTVQFQAGQLSGYSGENKVLEGVPEVRILDPRSAGGRPPLHQLYTRAVEQGLHKDVIASIRTLIPALEDIQILAPEDVPVVYLSFGAAARGGYALPAALAGDGIRLLLDLTLELAVRPGGLVLMEEPEVHMHPGAIRQCARAIVAAVRRGVQIVLSTHSLELIDALVAESSEEDLAKLALYRLWLQAGAPKPSPSTGRGMGSSDVVAQVGILKSSRLPGPDVAFSRREIEDDLR